MPNPAGHLTPADLQLIPVQHAFTLLGVSTAKGWRLVKSEQIRAVRIDSRTYVPLASLQQFIADLPRVTQQTEANRFRTALGTFLASPPAPSALIRPGTMATELELVPAPAPRPRFTPRSVFKPRASVPRPVFRSTREDA